jgi:GT2 family glycosyltransferase
MNGRFWTGAGADVAVIVVTFNSVGDLPAMLDSLRGEADMVRLRVIVVDNGSTDDSLAVATAHNDVTVVAAGGNLGYAGGINAAAGWVPDGEDTLILNPDLRVHPGAIARLIETSRSADDIGVVAPRILDDAGHTTESLHNEPTARRALVDAVLGPVWRARRAGLTEWVRDPAAYAAARDTDWASGAALLVRAEAAAKVGSWDERYFLYSEETDFCRRVRDAGYRVRFDPAAVVSHSQGGSGSSAALDALLNVNRVRYVRLHRPRSARAYRFAVLLGAALRACRSPGHRWALRYVAREASWARLPSATRSAAPRSVDRSIS